MAGVGEWQQMRDTNWWRNGQREAGHQLGAPLAADFHGGDVVYLGACFFPTQRSPRAPMDGDGQHVRPRSRALLTDDEDDGTYASDVYSGNLATGGSRAGGILVSSFLVRLGLFMGVRLRAILLPFFLNLRFLNDCLRPNAGAVAVLGAAPPRRLRQRRGRPHLHREAGLLLRVGRRWQRRYAQHEC